MVWNLHCGIYEVNCTSVNVPSEIVVVRVDPGLNYCCSPINVSKNLFNIHLLIYSFTNIHLA